MSDQLQKDVPTMEEHNAAPEPAADTNSHTSCGGAGDDGDGGKSGSNGSTTMTSSMEQTNENDDGSSNLDKNKNDNNHDRNKRKRKSNRWAWTKKWKEKKKRNKKENDNDSGATSTAGATAASADNDDKEEQDDDGTGRENRNNNNSEKDNNNNNRKKNERKKNDLTWTINPKEINEGSFACPNMQKLHNVHIDIEKVGVNDNNNNDSQRGTETDAMEQTQNSTSTTEVEAGTAPISSAIQSTEEAITTTNNNTTTKQENEEDETKLPKRKVALFIGFLGTKYMGFQMNKNQRTIQAEIELALYRAKLLSPSNFGYPNKYSWSSSARTDKGVHSCAQVCSVKILLQNDDMDLVREMINRELPDDIVILDVVRVARSFVAKTARDKVRYQYMLPSFILQDYAATRKLLQGTAGKADKRIKEWNELTSDEIASLRESLKTYRVSEETLQKLKDTLGRFSGTHKFHNYTSRKDAQDDSARRYIHKFVVVDKVVDEYGVEWIITNVLGQSFLLHQIRKMMSMAIDCSRGAVSSVLTAEDKDDIDVMEESFSPKYMTINVAPAQGLFLDMSFFDNYNKRTQRKGELLDWHSQPESDSVIRWKTFKDENVMKHIMTEEAEQNNFIRYLFIQELHLKHVKYESTEEKMHTNYNANKK